MCSEIHVPPSAFDDNGEATQEYIESRQTLSLQVYTKI